MNGLGSLGTLSARVVLDTTGLSASSALVKSTFLGLGAVAIGAGASILSIGSKYEDSLNTFQAVSKAGASR